MLRSSLSVLIARHYLIYQEWNHLNHHSYNNDPQCLSFALSHINTDIASQQYGPILDDISKKTIMTFLSFYKVMDYVFSLLWNVSLYCLFVFNERIFGLKGNIK